MKSLILLWLALSGPLGFQQAMLALSGASCVEELSEDEIARYLSLAAHPVDLNAAGRSRLLATGLLTPFQVASLLDYRTRSGAVLSWTELGLVDGFTPEMVDALQEFFVLGEPGGAPGQREDRRLRQSLTLRSAVRATLPVSSSPSGSLQPILSATRASTPSAAPAGGGAIAFGRPAATGGLKYEANFGERAAVYYSTRTTFSEPTPGWGTVSAAYYGRRALGQLIVGHFGARFGQGLVQWSGFQLSGYNSLGAFRRNGTGFSPTGSWSPSLFGIATDWHFGPWRLSAGFSFAPSLDHLVTRQDMTRQPIANLTYHGRRLTAGLTATGQAASLEARFALPAWSLFAELAASYPTSEFSATQPDFLSSVRLDSPTTKSVLPSSQSGLPPTVRTDLLAANLPDVSAAAGGSIPVRAVAGAIWVPAYGHKAGIVGRWLGVGKDYSGVALGYEGPALSLTADAAVRPDTRAFQLKSLLQWHPTWTFPLFALSTDSTASSARSSRSAAFSTTIQSSGPDSSSSTQTSDHLLTLQPLLRAQLRWRPSDAVDAPALSAVPASFSNVYPFAQSSLFPIFTADESAFRSAAFPCISATSSPGAAVAEPMVMPTASPLYATTTIASPSTVFPFAAAGVRLDLRAMLTVGYGPWVVSGRYDAVLGRGGAWNWYAELGWKSDSFSFYMRGGIFKVDDWDDRIYVYERDAPGSFTVPARYGRGWDAALYAAWRPARRHSFWLRLETVQYPWALSPKDGRLELRLQYRYQR